MKYNTDNIQDTGFIDKDMILDYVTEEEIFALVFGFLPKEFEYVTSPFRDDTNPGCWFERSSKGLRFIDFGTNDVVQGIRINNLDCFNAVQLHYNLPNFYRTMVFIKEHLLDGKPLKVVKKPVVVSKAKKKVEIFIRTRDFNKKDKDFWKPYGIKKAQLIEDKVFPVREFSMRNSRLGDVHSRVSDLCYAYTDFLEGRKKLYRPYGKTRFISNCTADDIGDFNTLGILGDYFIITKSYKDARVLRNLGHTSVWFQNEGMIPSEDLIKPMCSPYGKVYIFFDNDDAGILGAAKVKDYINSIFPNKASRFHLPIELLKEGIKDASDMYKHKSEKDLRNFLKQYI